MIINYFFRKIIFLKINVMITDKIQFRVRYSETDQMGYVYHGNYAQYFEMGRIEWLRKLGISYKKMEENGIMLPVIKLDTTFLKPAKYDNLVLLRTSLKKLPTAKIEFEYELFNEKNELLTKASTTLVFINMATNRPTKVPPYLLEKLQELAS